MLALPKVGLLSETAVVISRIAAVPGEFVRRLVGNRLSDSFAGQGFIDLAGEENCFG
jgi:hypothetical protein